MNILQKNQWGVINVDSRQGTHDEKCVGWLAITVAQGTEG